MTGIAGWTSWILRLNGLYDSLKDRARLAILVALVMPFIVLVNVGCAIWSFPVLLLGFAWFGVLFCFRMAWLCGSRTRRAG